MAVMLAVFDNRAKRRNVILLLPENPSEYHCVLGLWRCFRAQKGSEPTQSSWNLQESIQVGHCQNGQMGGRTKSAINWIFLIRHYSLVRMLDWVCVKEKCWPSYKRGLNYIVKVTFLYKKKKKMYFVLVCFVTFFFWWCLIHLHFWKHAKCSHAESKSM